MVKMRCGVYREGTVFSVDIELAKDVEALQEAIFYKQRYDQQYKFAYSGLTLYLARKKGETTWMKHNLTVKSILQGGISTGYEEMLSSWRLNKKELFGPDFQPGEEEIHVLVELPGSGVPAPI
ncbi:Crinkler (CRN) family protein [Phytophthora palmivora]|uniref:Crinkler (CRN) family protein n=1 Tax=Phytophthora palmivora TaxID=4796 RepID=A0A2P4YCG5_9STRA|nr:Crinkler (CRN) family protein [Phytophthora palmivora]